MDKELVHYYVTYSDTPQGDPLDAALQSSGVKYKLFGKKISLRYQHRWQLLFIGLPRLLAMGFGFVWNSLVIEKERPTVVIVGSHFEAFAFAMGRSLLLRQFNIVYLGFIYTKRANKILELMRRTYFSVLFRLVNMVICYSTHEIKRYGAIFPHAEEKFHFVPFGLHVPGSKDHVSEKHAVPRFFSAGRSGRDYQLLTKIFSENGSNLRIACDLISMQRGCTSAVNIEWLTACYNDKYLEELKACSAVVVPLSVDDISAGQMVVLQAMAFGKPVITTRTATMLDYATEESGVILTAPSNKHELSEVIAMVASNPEMMEQMSSKAKKAYFDRHTPVKFVQNLLRVISEQ